ncbi:hypothetical protein COU24_00730 [Candidatus Kuenenbacteria bacterium CG10_big_fil_rev_8_21_14_0_10_39_14]|uniref:DUF218 domain-containing protein n=1 Tax=Candidatus Kuenenbacteria bacterium CG10_big_fil_rev_8_21_14_0_10_39_14 TaxID=1974619 RepID=A0A2H0U6E3_9BACT|nr:MAG: hypothetical protein COU24_00730 [Candidatus Kuenenbacteria bacterium CG10_big_fil_rev_8_21_14_0_10_39_14]
MKISEQKMIIILGGALKRVKTGFWRTTNYNDDDDNNDNFGIMGDRLRVEAAGYLYQNNLNTFFIASGGKGQLSFIPDAVTVASVIERELKELGMPAKNIIKEEKSHNSFEQLREIAEIARRKKIKTIYLISNQYHLPRLRAMFKYAPGLLGLYKNIKVKLLSSEKICLKYDPQKWKKIIDQSYQSEAMKQRIKLEQQGIRDMKAGKYKFR